MQLEDWKTGDHNTRGGYVTDVTSEGVYVLFKIHDRPLLYRFDSPRDREYSKNWKISIPNPYDLDPIE